MNWRTGMPPPNERNVYIWDLPTRFFHWSLVLLVGANLFLVEPKEDSDRDPYCSWLRCGRVAPVSTGLGVRRQSAFTFCGFRAVFAGCEGPRQTAAASSATILGGPQSSWRLDDRRVA